MAYFVAQPALFEEPDDYVLENSPEATFVNVLDNVDFNFFREEEKLYYESLSDFNLKLAKKRKEKQSQQDTAVASEIKEDAYQSLLFEIIEGEPSKKSVHFEIPSIELEDLDEVHHNPKGAGRKPEDFCALTKAFWGVSYMGLENSPDVVHSQLINNPAFARKCGFKYFISEDKKLSQDNIPSLRKLEQFDQIMNDVVEKYHFPGIMSQ